MDCEDYGPTEVPKEIGPRFYLTQALIGFFEGKELIYLFFKTPTGHQSSDVPNVAHIASLLLVYS